MTHPELTCCWTSAAHIAFDICPWARLVMKMVEIELPYDDKRTRIHIPDDRLAAVLQPRHIPHLEEEDVLKEALSSPLGTPSLEKFLEGCEDVIFIVNDSTRQTPTARILDRILPHIPHGVKKSFIVACGTHRPPRDEEYAMLLGKNIAEDPYNTLLFHDARDPKQLVKVGVTESGRDVVINKHVAEATRVIVITSVEPHYFAGYTGGRKSFLPGVANYQSIEENHSFALDPGACTLRLEGNPVHQQMEEFARVAAGDKTFGVLTIVNQEGNVVGGACGDLFRSFYNCVDIAREVYTAPFSEKADVVISAAPHSMDINLYQAQKAMENGRLALNDGGILILVASCKEGVGPEDFYDLLRSEETPSLVLEKIRREYKLGYQKTAKIAHLQTLSEVWAYTRLDPSILEAVNMRSIVNLQSAVDEALEKTGGKVIVLPAGSITVPALSGVTECSKEALRTP